MKTHDAHLGASWWCAEAIRVMPILVMCLSNTRDAHLGGGAHGNTLSAANGRDADKVGAVVAVATDLGALAIEVALVVDLVDDHRAL